MDAPVTNNFFKETKEKLEVLNLLITSLSKLGIFFGLLIIFSYISILGFKPQGLGIGDVLVFVFAFLGFSIFISIGIVGGAAVLLWAFGLIDQLQVWRYRRWERKDSSTRRAFKGLRLKPWFRSWFLMGVSVLLSVVVVLILWMIHSSQPRQFDEILNLFLGFFMAGYVALLFVAMAPVATSTANSQTKIWINPFLIFALVIFTPLVFGSFPLTVKGSMMMAGTYQKNVPVELSIANYRRLKSVTANLGFNLRTCPVTESENILVLGLDVMWHGIGSRALVQINDNKKIEPISVELDDAGVWLLHTKLKPSKCNEP